MNRDDLDDRVRRVAAVDSATVDRVATAALESHGAARAAWPRTFQALTAGLVGAVSLSVWWCVQQSQGVGDGVFRAEAVVPTVQEGVYRAEAVPAVAPVGVVRVATGQGATWIFTTTPDGDWLPRGTALVVGGGAQK